MDNERQHERPESPASFPAAVVTRPVTAQQWLAATRMWWLAALSVAVAVGLTLYSLRTRGVVVVVHFRHGYGIKPGDVLQHRGIEAGRVVTVGPNASLDGIDIRLELAAESVGLAREGARFWIERPRVGLSGIRGIETVVGAKFVGVLPGAPDARPVREFVGVEYPLLLLDAEVTEITVRFQQGYGLTVGDPVKQRGIIVGEVTGVALDEQLTGVTVAARLVGSAGRLARFGSRFWVERPRVSVAEVRGLDTLVGGRYLALQPGADGAEPQREFDGLDNPPGSELPAGGLEIVLEGPQRWGVERGVAVMFRGVRVGQVVSVGLAPDGAAVEARVFIEPDYKGLVRANSQFWSASGVDLNVSLTGIRLSADTLASIAFGGVAFATPDTPGPPAAPGRRFELHRKPKDEWLAWRPRN